MMALLTLPRTLQNLLVVGPIYDKLQKFDEVEKMLPEFDWVVLNGTLSSHSHYLPLARKKINRIDQLLASKKVSYNLSGADLLLASSLAVDNSIEHWIRSKPNVILADFNQSFRVLIMSGGVPSHITTLGQLESNTEISFAPHPHETYSGGLGYVICNTPLTKWAPKFYPYSVQLGNTSEGQVYAFKVDRNGIQRTILV